MKTINIYCDESCHIEHDHKPYMLLSYLSVSHNYIEPFKKMLYSLKTEHNVREEIKWSNVFSPKEKFYFDLVDMFFGSEMRFRALIVPKAQIKKELLDGKSYDDFYYSMYWQLLYHRMNTELHYNIYLDIKDTRSAAKVRKLRDILKINYTNIRTLQNIRSHESIFMQLADFIMGAISYKLNVPDEKKTGRVSLIKNKIIHRIEKNCGRSLSTGTGKHEEKFNQFFIELR